MFGHVGGSGGGLSIQISRYKRPHPRSYTIPSINYIMKLLTAALVLTILGVILAVPMESTGAYRRHSRQSDIESGPNNEASTSRGSNTRKYQSD